jgi:DNA-binding transcriptional ArsR family regulator
VAEQDTRLRRRHRPAGASPDPVPDPPHRGVASELDTLIHERTRLGIVSALAARKGISFTELKSILGVTDGNLSAHARKLEDAGYITSSKRFEGRMPRTEYALTAAGRAALQHYVEHMENLISSVPRAG